MRAISVVGFTEAVTLVCLTPDPEQLNAVAARLSLWQSDPWVGHLHPGDLGWHSSVGAEQMAADLRVWERDGQPIAIGMADGPAVLRMAVDPEAAEDREVAERIAVDLDETATGREAVIEARGATALRKALRGAGWVEDEPWTPMTMELTTRLDLTRLDQARLRIVDAGLDTASDWAGVHWSSFRGTPFDDDSRSRFVDRWAQIINGPFADRAHSLIAYDADGSPVAVTTVWTAGPGRPGLVEPMGVHRERHGKGYGVAITLAGARTLQRHGASSVVVAAENSNPAALATYRAAGFTAHEQATDLTRP